jgi:hypothetical protein
VAVEEEASMVDGVVDGAVDADEDVVEVELEVGASKLLLRHRPLFLNKFEMVSKEASRRLYEHGYGYRCTMSEDNGDL